MKQKFYKQQHLNSNRLNRIKTNVFFIDIKFKNIFTSVLAKNNLTS